MYVVLSHECETLAEAVVVWSQLPAGVALKTPIRHKDGSPLTDAELRVAGTGKVVIGRFLERARAQEAEGA